MVRVGRVRRGVLKRTALTNSFCAISLARRRAGSETDPLRFSFIRNPFRKKNSLHSKPIRIDKLRKASDSDKRRKRSKRNEQARAALRARDGIRDVVEQDERYRHAKAISEAVHSSESVRAGRALVGCRWIDAGPRPVRARRTRLAARRHAPAHASSALSPLGESTESRLPEVASTPQQTPRRAQ